MHDGVDAGVVAACCAATSQCNAITCCAVSEDKRWIATADSGPDSMIVVWDSRSCTPIKSIFNVRRRRVCVGLCLRVCVACAPRHC